MTAAWAVLALLAASAPPGADEIVQRCDEALKGGRTQQAQVAMMVKRPEWSRTLEMTAWWARPDRSFVRITAPAKEAGTATLRVGSNMWNYLPRVERTVKIPPSLMLQPWMGSDFANDDLVRESSLVVDYTHRLDGSRTVDGDDCWAVTATPKPDAAVVWGKVVLAIRKSDYLPREQQFYDEHGRLKKTLRYESFRTEGGHPYPMVWRMVPADKPGEETTLAFHSVEFDRPIAARIFTQDHLTRDR